MIRVDRFKHWVFLLFCVSSSVIVDSLHFPNAGLNLVLKRIVGKFVQTVHPVMGFEGNKRISPFIILIFGTNSEWASEKTSHLLCQKSDPPLNKNPLNKPVERGFARPGKGCKLSSSGKFCALQCPQKSVIRNNGWTEINVLNIGVAWWNPQILMAYPQFIALHPQFSILNALFSILLP